MTPVSGETMAFLEYGETDCNSIYEIDPSGTKHEIFESQGVVPASGCHGNALRYSQKEDVYTFSDVSPDIYVVDRAGARPVEALRARDRRPRRPGAASSTGTSCWTTAS